MSRMASCSLSEMDPPRCSLMWKMLVNRRQLLKSVIERFVIGDTTLLNEIVVAPVLFTFTSDLGHH